MQPPSRAGVMRAFGKTIRELRLFAGISQERLALEAGVSRRYMSGLEQGRHNPTLELVCRLLPTLKISLLTFAEHFESHLRGEKTGSDS
jgi:transcriptional regulator with XRE-family HTH domain